MTKLNLVDLLHDTGFDTLFRALPDAIFAFDLTGTMIYGNEQLYNQLGIAREQYHSPFGTLVVPEQRERVLADFASASRGETREYTASATLPDSRVIRVHVTLLPLFHEGAVVAVVGMARDIEELEASREVRTALELQLESVLNNISDGFFLFTHDWRFSYVNPRGEAIAQRSRGELIGKRLWDEFPDMRGSEFGIAYRTAIAENRTVTVRDHYAPLGTWLEATAYPHPDGLAVSVRDVTAEEVARLQVEKSEKRLATQGALLDVAHDAITVRDMKHFVQYWNAAATRTYGWTADEALGSLITDLIFGSTEAFDAATAATLSTGYWRGEMAQHTKSGSTLIADSSWTLIVDSLGEPESIMSVHTDITASRRQDAILQRAQRVASLGTFASGIAHDLNNVLTPILTSAQLLAEDETDHDRLQLLTTIESGAARGADMVRQVLSFARGAEGRRERIDTVELLGEFREMCRTSLPKHITMTVAAKEHPLDASGDATQMLQVLMNLAFNARDAMPDGGTLTISTRNAELTAAEASRRGVNPGFFVVIDVEDTGTGMSAETMSHIFEPFFTTKGPGSGTGLGLATSQAILSGHGGFLQVYSELGNGSRFQLHLPAATVATPEAAESDTASTVIVRGNGELVLVVDDEQEIRTSTRRALEIYGYTVAVASNGREALDFLAKEARPVALIVTDVMMPVMDGIALASALADASSAIPLVAMSGLSNNESQFEFIEQGVAGFLAKPFTTGDLLRAVHDAIHGPGGGTHGG